MLALFLFFACGDEGKTLSCDGDILQECSDDGSCETLIIEGCTDSNFIEYYIYNGTDFSITAPDPVANTDDGSCLTEIMEGCTNILYIEYNP